MYKNTIDFSFILFLVTGFFEIVCGFLNFVPPIIITTIFSITTWLCLGFLVFGTFAILLYIKTFDESKMISLKLDIPLERVAKTVETNLTASITMAIILIGLSLPLYSIIALITAASYYLIKANFINTHLK